MLFNGNAKQKPEKRFLKFIAGQPAYGKLPPESFELTVFITKFAQTLTNRQLYDYEKIENDKRSANKVFDAILSKMSVDIQDTMIEREKQALVADFKQKVAQSGVTWEDVLKQDGAEKIDKELREEAISRIKNSLMMSEIAKLENIQVTAQDLEQKIGEMASLYQTDKDTIFREIRKNTALIQSLSQQALSQKVTKFLIDNNKIKFVAEAKK